jgi:phospho-N-acetylmuramoyl-pentapeptide-transferase
VWLGVIGFLDDYLKIKARKAAQAKGEKYQKKDKDGLAGVSKIIGQVGLGIIIGATLYFNPNVTVERHIIGQQISRAELHTGERITKDSNVTVYNVNGTQVRYVKVQTPITTIPFVKNHEFNYSSLISWIGKGADKFTWVIYIWMALPPA